MWFPAARNKLAGPGGEQRRVSTRVELGATGKAEQSSRRQRIVLTDSSCAGRIRREVKLFRDGYFEALMETTCRGHF